MSKTFSITVAQQLEEQAREVGMSRSFFARLVRERRMSPEEALKHLARKMAILETLTELSRNQEPLPRIIRMRTVTAEIED